MDQVHMQQEIDGTVRDLHCRPDAVDEWTASGWSVVEPSVVEPTQPADEPPADPAPVTTTKQARAAGEKQEG